MRLAHAEILPALVPAPRQRTKLVWLGQDVCLGAASISHAITIVRLAQVVSAQDLAAISSRKSQWRACCSTTGMSWDIFVGRSLALCAHPHLAWRYASRRSRLVVVAAYFVAGYAAGLVGLLAF